MGSTPVAVIDQTGIHVPAFPDVLAYFQTAYRAIYGDDVYISPDSRDGQFLGILAAAINDANAMAVQCYNAFSPATAQGTGLSSVVKINGIARKIPTASTADILVVGQAGTTIQAGIISDANNLGWALPTGILIPYSGQIVVTATCLTLGAVQAPANTITTIVNTQPGWQTVTNPGPATVGAPVETDAQLRARQTASTEIPGEGLLAGTIGAVWSLPGVNVVAGYENPGNVPDVNGIPGHCIALVIDGGNVTTVAQAIAEKKGGGVGTYGNIVQTVTDKFGVPHQIAWFRPIDVPVAWSVKISNLGTFSLATQAMIAQALSDWTNNLGIGTQLRIRRAYVPANLSGVATSGSYELLGLGASRGGAAPVEADVTIAFNERAFCDPSYVRFVFPPGG